MFTLILGVTRADRFVLYWWHVARDKIYLLSLLHVIWRRVSVTVTTEYSARNEFSCFRRNDTSVCVNDHMSTRSPWWRQLKVSNATSITIAKRWWTNEPSVQCHLVSNVVTLSIHLPSLLSISSYEILILSSVFFFEPRHHVPLMPPCGISHHQSHVPTAAAEERWKSTNVTLENSSADS